MDSNQAAAVNPAELDPQAAGVFAFFNEIGILSQLSTALLARVLPDGVHPSHFAIMNHLSRRGDGKTPVRIADAMQVTKATMTHSLAVLEKRGFVRTEPSLIDARSKGVFLTSEGRRFHASAIAAVLSTFSALLGPSDLEHMAAALPALRAIRKLLDDNRTPPSPAASDP